ncbi:mycothiol-dependent maleylpyruvate isomerase [Corynebacterium humireducens NBRC 106098 = DSM 45392]|uniref:Mycothiol-dependent maleylpyruvate isomerase n=1 Tax=Corynebacterium humireducens NBRC 106098 = DSM 45392 TaxID=1223515 RepID=A0A0B5DAE2_9CORY|nr:maleylpyruvate isomerase family mycothiol-dependent enzyme [Corynebacterium humireducens]AJE32684.1 mycothiol-dependent maleylpyruvate isomerase [Corynebacterium humireducens NBRC 106098 = DSM 45392]
MGSFHDLSIEERLNLTRRGTAHYSGQLALIDNADFGRDTLLPGWTVAHLAAHVAYNANALCNLMEWAETGVEKPMYPSPQARGEEIDFGATLIPDAIRNLHDHTLVRLDVAWRDATDEAWQAEVRTAQGRTVPASETLWMRAREVWIHSVDLDVNAGFSDIPEVILETLVPEIAAKWRGAGDGAGLVLVPEGNERIEVSPGEDTVEIHGSWAGLARWASGRGDRGVTSPQGEVPAPPRWL